MGNNANVERTEGESPVVLPQDYREDEVWPAIEYDACYPVDEDFTAFKDLPLSFAMAGEWLLRELPRAAEHMSCFCWITRAKDILDRPVHRIHFSTGGWSGAESIIGLINRRVDLNRLKLSWKRGGHYVFEVPVRPTSRSISDIRKQAWETRRRKYGDRGHCGSYSRTPSQIARLQGGVA